MACRRAGDLPVGREMEWLARRTLQRQPVSLTQQQRRERLRRPGRQQIFTVDLRVRYQFTRQLPAALGIDNLNNYRYWNFHPYPQRSYTAELKFDL